MATHACLAMMIYFVVSTTSIWMLNTMDTKHNRSASGPIYPTEILTTSSNCWTDKKCRDLKYLSWNMVIRVFGFPMPNLKKLGLFSRLHCVWMWLYGYMTLMSQKQPSVHSCMHVQRKITSRRLMDIFTTSIGLAKKKGHVDSMLHEFVSIQRGCVTNVNVK